MLTLRSVSCRTTVRRTAAAVAAAALVVVVGGAAPVPAAAPACGTLIESSTTLTADLDCSGSRRGLLVAADVTLDLGGHTVTGGTRTGIGLSGDATVRNGTVTGSQVGVQITHDGTPRSHTVSDLVVTHNDIGLLVAGTEARRDTRLRIERLVASYNREGVECSNTSCTLVDSTLVGNRSVGLESSFTELVVARTHVTGNGDGLRLYGADRSQRVTSSSFTDNQTAISAGGGVLEVTASSFDDNRLAVLVARAEGTPADRTALLRNEITDNDVGVRLLGPPTAVQHNVFRGNATGLTTEASSADGEQPQPYRHAVVGNLLVQNGDGLVSANPLLEVRANVATRNTRWGIHAPGSRDLGGNVGFGNGYSPQVVLGPAG